MTTSPSSAPASVIDTPSLRPRLGAFALSLYRNWRLYIEPERLRMRRVCREWIGQTRPAGFILEIGGGTAFLKSMIEKEVSGVRYLSGDIAPTNATGIVLDAVALPLADDCADAVLALEVLEHIERPEQMISEVARVMRKDAIAIVTVPFMFGVHDFRDYHRFTPLGFETLLNAHGLALDDVRQRGGTFVAATGLVRTLILNTIVGKPKDWRAQGLRKKILWIVATIVLTPWTLVTWAAFGLDRMVDGDSQSPPGYFFLIRKNGALSDGAPNGR